MAIIGAGAAALLAWGLYLLLGEASPPAMIFVAAVLITSVRLGLWPGFACAVTAFVLLNFLFAEPRFSLSVSHPDDLVTLPIFLLVAGLTGLMAGRLREQRNAAEGRAWVLSILSRITAEFPQANDVQGIIAIALRHLAQVTAAPVLAIQRDHDGCTILAAIPADFVPSSADLVAADISMRHRHIEHGSEKGWAGTDFTFAPFTCAPNGGLALGYRPPSYGISDFRYREEAINIITTQTRLALERLTFAQSAQSERQRADDFTQRAALLTSLSHDLRTPLATILGSVTTLHDFGAELTTEAQKDLLKAAIEESERLSRYVSNMLQLTRLEMGTAIRMSLLDPADIARQVIFRLSRTYPDRITPVQLPDDLPMVLGEAALLEQALTNLIENALKYSSGPIGVTAQANDGWVQLGVSDQGPGLPPVMANWLNADTLQTSSCQGLGLPICKAIARAFGGRLSTSQAKLDATLITLHLPAAPLSVELL